MSARLLVPPAVEPITLEQARAQIPVTSPDQDANLSRAIAAARSTVETYCERALIASTWRLNVAIGEREAALGYLELAPSPVAEILAVTIIDPDPTVAPWRAAPGRIVGPVPTPVAPGPPAVPATLAALGPHVPGTRILTPAEYTADLDVEPARLWLGAWPTTPGARVAVTFKAGYGNDGTAVPPALVQVMLQLVGLYFEHREDVASGARLEALPGGNTAREQLAPWRVLALA